MAARACFILDFVVVGTQGYAYASGVFWLTAPANRTIPLPNFVSRVPSAAPESISAAEIAALQAGTVVEQTFQSGLFGTTPEIQNDVDKKYASASAALNASAFSTKLIGAYADINGVWTLPP